MAILMRLQDGKEVGITRIVEDLKEERYLIYIVCHTFGEFIVLSSYV